MTNKNTKVEDREALERLLDVYGADRTRWPARERLRFASFISEDEAAQRLVAESAALDALLDRAPRASEDRERALKERIVAAALRSAEPQLAVVSTGEENALPRLPAWLRYARRAPSPTRTRERREWPAAGLLAASLMIGVMLGSAGMFDTTVQDVAEASGFTSAGEPSQLALGEDIIAMVDEDLL
jgi:anti-sigma factor RsiW